MAIPVVSRDLLTGTAWVDLQHGRARLRLIEEGGEWMWVNTSGKIMAGGNSRSGAVGALLVEFGEPRFGLVFEVSGDASAADLCPLADAKLESDPEPPRKRAVDPAPPRQGALF
jgi:hypothetical protein